MRTIPPAFCLLASLSLSCCLELEERIAIRADGSGTQSLQLWMSDRGLEAARQFAPARAARETGKANAPTDPRDLFDPALVRREVTAAGLTCVDVRTPERRGRQSLEVDAEFADLAALGRSPLTGGEAAWQFGAGAQAGTVCLVFYPRGEAAWREAWERAQAMDAGLGEREREWFERTRPQVEGLQIRWVLDLPGDVIAHSQNLRVTAARQVTAVLRAEDVSTPKELVRALASRYEVTFDGRDFRLPLPEPAPAKSP